MTDLSRFRAVIFDMDGLLFDTERLYRIVSGRACAGQGFELTDGFYATMIGVPNAECNAMLQDHFGERFDLTHHIAACQAGWAEHLAAGVPLKPGARELLHDLHGAGMPLALATSSRRPVAEHHLGQAGLLPLFDAVATRDDVERGKPFPDLFLKAAADLAIPPADCLVFEDSHAGVRAAKAAGCTPVMVPDLLEASDEMVEACLMIAESLEHMRPHFTGQARSLIF